MRNDLMSLNNYLFEQLENVTDQDCTPEEHEKHLKTAKAVADISSQIVKVANVQLNAVKIASEYGDSEKAAPVTKLLLGGE